MWSALSIILLIFFILIICYIAMKAIILDCWGQTKWFSNLYKDEYHEMMNTETLNQWDKMTDRQIRESIELEVIYNRSNLDDVLKNKHVTRKDFAFYTTRAN